MKPILFTFLFALLFSPISLISQRSLKVEPSSLDMKVGDVVTLSITVFGEDGKELAEPRFQAFSPARRSLEVDRVSGEIKAHKGGTYSLVVLSPVPDGDPLRVEVAVTVAFPDLERVVFLDPQDRIYVGSSVVFPIEVFDATKAKRDDVEVVMTTSDESIASMNSFGQLVAHRAGSVDVIATAGDVSNYVTLSLKNNPVVKLEMSADLKNARTGDVVKFKTTALDASGEVVGDAPISFSLNAKPLDGRGPSATGQIKSDGRFVAEQAGLYTVVAQTAGQFVSETIEIIQRDVKKKLTVLGQGRISESHTSDLWVWESASDGRDYAITGTWGGEGKAYFWDVTDPENLVRVDSVQVDARTVNDVKVSEDGKTCVIGREGASNRKNGLVIVDCSDPTNVEVIANYDDELTGGVHNVFIYDNHVYAVNNGRRYDVINIEDPKNPYRVSRFELGTPGHAVHDVWIKDGIAYSSNWGDGLQLVDVGSGTARGALAQSDVAPIPDIRQGLAGGSPANPVQFADYQYPSGRNHAAFPFHSESTNKFYVVGGDETFPYGLNRTDKPTRAAGYLHFVDFTDPGNPDEIARYEVPEAGSHNYWIEDDILYAAFYNGGLRVVDISGELMGDLYKQGREIAFFYPDDPDGFIANAPMVWGPQPHKGTIFFTDWNSGLWAVSLEK